MRSVVHLFDGYLLTQGRVRARCSCGYLSTPQAAQRPARLELSRSHGFTPPVCDDCGRGNPSRSASGVPDSLQVHVDPWTGEERVLCVPGSGGCEVLSRENLVIAALAPSADGTSGADSRRGTAERRLVAVAMAQGVLMGRLGIGGPQARVRLYEQAASQGVSVVEAADRLLAATGSSLGDPVG